MRFVKWTFSATSLWRRLPVCEAVRKRDLDPGTAHLNETERLTVYDRSQVPGSLQDDQIESARLCERTLWRLKGWFLICNLTKKFSDDRPRKKCRCRRIWLLCRTQKAETTEKYGVILFEFFGQILFCHALLDAMYTHGQVTQVQLDQIIPLVFAAKSTFLPSSVVVFLSKRKGNYPARKKILNAQRPFLC